MAEATMARVVLKNDPQRGGWATDEREERGGRMFRKVLMDSGRREWIPEDQLEAGGSGGDSPLDMLKAGKVSAPSHLRRALLHIRLFGRLTDMIYSMEATNTDFYPHQFKPVLKLLRSPAQGILIADEVGLGKTIEAGLIWTELRARYDFRRMLVFCPAVLREKWRDELTLKMGMHPRVCQNAREVLETLQSGEHRARGFALICAQQGLRLPRKKESEDGANDPRARLAQFLRESQDDPPIDLLVVDEAQHIRNPESRTHAMGRLLRGASRYAVFLSATPLANKNRDMFMLLNLLDGGAFEHERDFENVLDANQPVIELRDKILRGKLSAEDFHAGLAKARGHSLLRNSEQLSLLESERLTDADLARHETQARLAERLEHAHLLGHVVTRTRKKDIGIRASREVVDEPVKMTPAEREVYELVTSQAVEYAKLREGPAEFFLMTPQRQMASSMVSALSHWRAKTEDWEAGEWDDEGESGSAALTVAAEIYRDNRKRLDALDPKLRGGDSKYNRLVERLDDHFRTHPPEKAIVFSTFPGTLEYLRERLTDDRPQWGSVVLRGGGTAGDKMDLVGRFREDDNARILLSSEVGGEGIDLQFCWLVVNYDMPWNPMRLEQRIGRVDRIGQRSEKILVWNLLHEGTIDERIYQAVGTKEWLSRRALGDAEAVIAREFRELTRELLLGELSEEQKKRRLDNAKTAVEMSVRAMEQLETEAGHLIAHGDYLLRQIRGAHDEGRWVTPDDLAAYVGDFMRTHGGVFQHLNDEGDYEIALPADETIRLRQFVAERKGAYGGAFLRGDRAVRVCFGGNRAVPRGGKEIVTHTHPLVRFIADDTERNGEKLRPVIAAKLSSVKSSGLLGDAKPGIYVIAGALWSFQGGAGRIEKIAYAGKRADVSRALNGEEAETIAIAAAKVGAYWPQWQGLLDRKTAVETAALLFTSLDDGYREFASGLTAEAGDRAEIQRQSARRQAEREESRIQSAIAALREKGRGQRMIDLQKRQLEFAKQRLQYREKEIDAAMGGIRHRSSEAFVAVVLVE